MTVKYIADIDTPTDYTGYLVDGDMFVPFDTGNRHYIEIQEWIASGNVVEEAFTNGEVAKHNNDKIVAEAKQYLIDTDWYIVREQDSGKAVPEEVKQKRAEARKKI